MIWAVLAFLVVVVPAAEGQIRTGWGLTAPCKVVTNGTANFFSVNFLDNCDMWHAPHIANPFLLMMFTRNYWAAFFVSGVFEIVECLMVMGMDGFGLFAGAANSLENMPDALVDDWLIQAGLGTLLGIWVCWYFNPPVMWTGWRHDKGRFVAWFMWYVAIMLTQTLYGLNLNDDDPTGFPLGPTICVAAIALVFAFLIQTEPGMHESWHGRTRYDRLVFWMAVVTIYFSFYYVVQFDFFFSSAAQTWLLWGVWILTWFVLALVHGRGKELVLILNGAFNKKKTSVQ